MPDVPMHLIERLATVRDEDLLELAHTHSVEDLLQEVLGVPTHVTGAHNRVLSLLPPSSTGAAGWRFGWRQLVPRRSAITTLRRLAVAGLVVAAASAGLVVAFTGSSPHLLFPNGAAPSASKGVTVKASTWRLTSVINYRALSESRISPTAASMLSCASSSRCYAISNAPIARFSAAPDYLFGFGQGTLNRSSDGGNSWSSVPLPHGVVFTTPLSCHGPDTCVAGGLVLGQSQTIAQAAPSNSFSITHSLVGPGNEATSTGNCDLGSTPAHGGLTEAQVLAVLDNFSKIANAASPGTRSTGSEIQCASTIATDVSGALSRLSSSGTSEGLSAAGFNVPTGSALTSLEGELSSASLWRTDGSTAVIESTTDGGASWSTVALPPGTGAVTALSCPNGTTCAGLVRTSSGISATAPLPWVSQIPSPDFEPVAFIKTTNDGASWTTSSFANADEMPDTLTCSSASTCIAVGATGSGGAFTSHAGIVLRTSDGGVTWTSSNLPSNVTEVRDITCPTTGTCFAIGDKTVPNPQPCPSGSAPLPSSYRGVCFNGPTKNQDAALTSADGGATWSLLTLPAALTSDRAGNMALSSVSCTDAMTCSFSGNVSYSSYGRLATGESFVNAPDGTSFNATTGSGSGPAMIAATTDAGSTWTVTTFGWEQASGNQLLETTQVQCPASNACVAIGGSSSFATPVLVGPSS